MSKLQGETPAEVADLISDLIKGKKVCDLGCGDGKFMLSLAKYASEVVGLEEVEDVAMLSKDCDFKVPGHIKITNGWFEVFPDADVYYAWSKDAIGMYWKAKYEGKKGIFIFGWSVRPFFQQVISKIETEFRRVETPGFKGVYITKL